MNNSNRNLKLAITLQFIAFLIVVLCDSCSAQTTTTVFTKTYSVEKLSQLNNHLTGTVEVIETKSQRVIVECTVTVTHPKSEVVSNFIASNSLLTPKVITDVATRTMSIATPELKPMIVDKKDVEVKTSYRIFAPAGLNIL